MALTSAKRDGEIYMDGVCFCMRLGAQDRVVHVTRQTLHDSEDVPFVPFDELVRFRAHRERFEQIARDKYERGAIQDDGSIRIINGDLNA